MTSNQDPLRVDLIEKYVKPLSWFPAYDQWVERRINQELYQEEFIRLLFETFGLHSHSHVLDLGCGMGGLTVALWRHGIKAYAIDPNADYCRITQTRGFRYALDIPILRGVGEQFPFADAAFDLVICRGVIEHAVSPSAILAEIFRVLRRQGQAYVDVANRFCYADPHYHMRWINWIPRSTAEKIILYKGRSKEGGPCSDNQRLSDMHYMTWGQFRSQAERAGFRTADLLLSEVEWKGLPAFPGSRLVPFFRLADKMKLNRVVYQCFHRPLFLSTFHARLMKL